jgi:hypothetical protein
MTDTDPGGYAELWLAELGAWVPEWHDGGALAPRLRRFGLDRTPRDRARLSGRRLDGEARAARAHRALADGANR